MRGEATALRLVGPGVTAWYSRAVSRGVVGPAEVSRCPGGWSGGAAVGMAQAVAGKLAAVLHSGDACGVVWLRGLCPGRGVSCKSQIRPSCRRARRAAVIFWRIGMYA
jgi:hypothetical protein